MLPIIIGSLFSCCLSLWGLLHEPQALRLGTTVKIKRGLLHEPPVLRLGTTEWECICLIKNHRYNNQSSEAHVCP